MISITVSPDVRDFFTGVEIHGQGGFQSLCRHLADKLTSGRTLRLRPEEFKRIVRYSNSYGDGGFQSKLRKIVATWVGQNIDTLV